MAHKVLYRVYRPRVFDDVYGQSHITDVLKKQVMSGNISHAYIFSGPRGTGKTSTAKILAMALNCENNSNGNPCLKCAACSEAIDEKLVDIIEIDAASNNGVENIRDIREKISLLPVTGKYKVYIIDEVHMLSSGAFNALLKTLEEPPEHAVFILATTELRKVPKTILSRCQQYDFRRIRVDEIIKRLAFVANEAGIRYEEKALSLIARASEGALRDALSMLDMCWTYGDVTEKSASEIIGMPDSENTEKLCSYIIEGNPELAADMTEKMMADGVECENILRDAIACLGDLIKDNFHDKITLEKIVYSINVLIDASGTFRYASVPKSKLLAAIVGASMPECNTDISPLELRVTSLEKKVSGMTAQARRPVVAETEKKPSVENLDIPKSEPKVQPVAPADDRPSLFGNISSNDEESLKKIRETFK